MLQINGTTSEPRSNLYDKNKLHLLRTDPRDALHHVRRAVHIEVGAQCDVIGRTSQARPSDVHVCVQHDVCDAARRAGPSATAETGAD